MSLRSRCRGVEESDRYPTTRSTLRFRIKISPFWAWRALRRIPGVKDAKINRKGYTLGSHQDLQLQQTIQQSLMNDPSVQSQVTAQQINFIIESLEVMHKHNHEMLRDLNLAKEVAQTQSMKQVAEIVHSRLVTDLQLHFMQSI